MDETIARAMQRRYLEGEPHALPGLYSELRYLARGILRGRNDADEIAHHAASRIIERYMRKPGIYRIQHFGYMVSREVAHAMLYGGNEAREKPTLRLVVEPSTSTECSDELRPVEYVKDLQQTPIGRRAILDLCMSWGYRRAILEIESYAGRDWIYARAVQLHTVYRMMHRGKKIRARQLGRRSVARDKAPVQGIPIELQLRRQSHAAAMEQREAEG